MNAARIAMRCPSRGGLFDRAVTPRPPARRRARAQRQEFHLRQCGLRSIATKGVNALCTAAVRHAGQSLDLLLFGTLTGILDPPHFSPAFLDVGLLALKFLMGGEDPQVFVCVRARVRA
jgi:hypothetical protein